MTEKKGHGSETAKKANAEASHEGKSKPRTSSPAQAELGKKGGKSKRDIVPPFSADQTPDGRYIVVRGRLWRRQRPDLEPAERDRLVHELMDGRRGVKAAKRTDNVDAMAEARAQVDRAKRGLGERGPVWWTDGAPDQNRRLVENTSYAEWYADLSEQGGEP
ncbi:hypothetical protein GGR33_002748 [Methylobacterium brachythecii]|uniref:Uncharacterized protein n=1 Tax=Methylobacterium brachythecii TaxID=1176177 RepID=A0A7W6F7M4_9HYPH|nr:hypothetical protein [Methylobacterium brachythecii]GLS46024.1 hypothetical protein GCM10007884_40150 [Methylobacterium brachythecii]